MMMFMMIIIIISHCTVLHKLNIHFVNDIVTIDCLTRESSYEGTICRVVHNSLRDVRPLRYSSRDGHAEGEHVNRGRDTASFCPTLQVLDSSFLLCLS
jgi:hypothetical protein